MTGAVVAVDVPMLATPAFEASLRPPGGGGYYGWYGAGEDVERRILAPGAGGFVRVHVDDGRPFEWVAQAGSRVWAARWDVAGGFATTQAQSHLDVGIATGRGEEEGHVVFPGAAVFLGLGGTTIHATHEGTLTAFAPHLQADGSFAVGGGPVKLRLGATLDAFWRGDAWGETGEVPEGAFTWRINAGSASMRAYAGVEVRPSR